MKIKSWLQSSQNPEQVSQSIRGAVLMSSGIILFILTNLLNINVNQADFIYIATFLGTLGGAMYGLAGLIMKIIMKFGEDK